MPGRQPSPRLTELLLLSLLASGAVACVPRITLDRAVMAYDRTTAESVAKQLLLNIARARRNQPMHFTAISNIAATYRFSANAGVSPALTGDKGFLVVPLIGASAEENPTISISPMQGEGVHPAAAHAVRGGQAHAAPAPGLRRPTPCSA
jgi:hypothetical protein